MDVFVEMFLALKKKVSDYNFLGGIWLIVSRLKQQIPSNFVIETMEQIFSTSQDPAPKSLKTVNFGIPRLLYHSHC